MKGIIFLVAVFSVFVSYSQQAEVIILDSLNAGHYIDYELDADGNLYVLDVHNTFSQITIAGEVLASHTYDCGLVCGFTDADIAPDGTVYFTSDVDGLFRRESDYTITNILDERISKMAIDGNGVIAVLGNSPSANFIFQIFKNGVWTEYTKDNSPFESSWTYDLKVDVNNRFWIAGADGLFSFKNGQFQNYTSDQVYYVNPNSQGDLAVVFGNEAIGVIENGSSSIVIVPWQQATGRWAVLNKYGTLYVADGEEVLIRKNNVWTEYDLADIGANGWIGREMQIDDNGNVFYSLDGESDIYYWESQLVDIKTVRLEDDIALYPNPTSSSINVSSLENISSFTIYDQVGLLVDQRVLNDNKVELNVGDYSNGLYILNMVSAKGSVSKSFVINH